VVAYPVQPRCGHCGAVEQGTALCTFRCQKVKISSEC
jgi:hypothetical protein